MTTVDSQLLADIKALSVEEKLLLVEWILSNLHKSDPEIDKLWSVEAERRLDAYNFQTVEFPFMLCLNTSI